MNRSGAALALLRADAAFDPARDLLILVDDFQIPVGTFRFRSEGSAGGHNGLKSIEAALQSQQYGRLRVGVGPLPEGVGDWADYVLAAADPDQHEAITSATPQMIDAVERWIRLYEAEREEGEAFNDCAERIGAPRFEEEVADLALPPEFSLETMQMFIDWKAKVPFEVIRGEGECAV